MKKLSFIFLLAFPVVCFAQQGPIYSYSTIYPIDINPAFTGMSNSFQSSLRFRTQWQNVPGSPKNISFNAVLPVVGNKVGVGLSIIKDQLGVSNYLYANALFSYKIKMSDGYLSFGLNTGLVQIKNSYSELLVRQQGDVFDNNEQTTNFTFGAGLVYSNDKVILALGAPSLLKTQQQIGDVSVNELGRIFTVIGAYDLKINANLVVRPSVLFRMPSQGKLSYDLKLAGIITNKIKVGAYTRNLDYLGFTMGFLLNRQYKFGYNYEIPISNNAPTQFNAHELTLSIRVKMLENHFFSKWF